MAKQFRQTPGPDSVPLPAKDTVETDIQAFNEAESKHHPAWDFRQDTVLPGPKGGVQITEEDQMLEEIAHDFAYRDYSNLSPEEHQATSARLHALGYEMPKVLNDDYKGAKGTGFQSLSLTPMEGSQRDPIMAFRGTSNLGGAETDLDKFGVGTAQYNANYSDIHSEIDRLKSETGQNVITTGHSLGGSLAQRAALDSNKVGKINTYQGAGINEGLRDQWRTKQSQLPEDDRQEVKHFYSDQDLVHLAGKHLDGENIAVQTSGAPNEKSFAESFEAVEMLTGVAGGHTKNGLTSGDLPAWTETAHQSDTPVGAEAEKLRVQAGNAYRRMDRTSHDVLDFWSDAIGTENPGTRTEWSEDNHNEIVDHASNVEKRELNKHASRSANGLENAPDGSITIESEKAIDERMKKAHRKEFHENAIEPGTVGEIFLKLRNEGKL